LWLCGRSGARAGRASQAIWLLRRAAEFPGFETAAGVDYARTALEADDARTAIDAANRVLEREAGQRPALDIRAEAQLRKGDFEAALADIDALRARPEIEDEIELARLRALVGLRRIDEAEALFAELEAKREKGELELPAGRYCAARATFHAERGQIEQARADFERCFDAAPADPLVLSAAIDFFDARGMSAALEPLLRRALERDPKALNARQELALRLRRAGRAADAEALLVAGTQLDDPLLAASHSGALAQHHFALGNYAAAAAAWAEVVQRVGDPGADVWLAYADALALAGQGERALEVAQRLPEMQRALVRGRLRFEQREPREALAALDEAVRLWPDNPAARYYAARAAEVLGDFERAISEYRAAIRAGAGVTDAGLRLARLHFAEGAYATASFALYQHLEQHRDDAEAYSLYAVIEERQGRRERAREVREALGRLPGQRGRALEELAAAIAEARGPEAALTWLAERLAHGEHALRSDPRVLGAQLALFAQLGRASEALAPIRAALSEAPHSGELLALEADALARSGAPPGEVAALVEPSLALAPESAALLRAAARAAAAAGDAATAAQRYARALERVARGSAEEPALGAEAARQLVESGQAAAAEPLLEELLWRHPIDSALSELLAECVRARDPGAARVRELEARARRFGVATGATAGGQSPV
jgi:tetratricopeptide (TPR) repeat protein